MLNVRIEMLYDPDPVIWVPEQLFISFHAF